MAAELAAAGLEGGSPARVMRNWTIPMYRAQLRYWADHPRLDQLARAYFKIKPRYTPPEQAAPKPLKIDWSKV